jgi:hypothetical protein
VAVGVTHADAAALFAASTADDVFLATYEEAAGLDLGSVRRLHLAADDAMGDLLAAAIPRVAAGDLEVQVEYAGAGPARDAVTSSLAATPDVHVTRVSKASGRVVLDLSGAANGGGDERTVLLDALAGPRPADRPGGNRPPKRPAAPPDPPAPEGGRRLVERLAGLPRSAHLGILALAGLVLLLVLLLVGLSDLGGTGVVVVLLLAVLVGQAGLGLLVLLTLRRAGRARVEAVDAVARVEGKLVRRTDRILEQGRKSLKAQKALPALRRRADDTWQLGLRQRALATSRFEELQRTQNRLHLDTQRQIQANLELQRMVRIDGRIPPMGGWAASPDLLVLILDEVLTVRPRTVVECGSGTSTLLLALLAEQQGLDMRIVALEHLERFKADTEAALARHGVAHRAEVRLAPLTPTSLPDHETLWYDESALADLEDIGILVVDGPPTATGPLVRYPAIPLMRDKLADTATVVMDDLIRESDHEVAQRWRDQLPDFEFEKLVTLQKHAGIFRRTRQTVARSRPSQ